MRKSLAPHVRARWERIEVNRRILLALQVQQEAQIRQAQDAAYQRAMAANEKPANRAQWLESVSAAAVPAAWCIQPDQTALEQRAARAERNAASWHRLAILLAVACALLLVLR